MTGTLTRLPNKQLREVVNAAERRGWTAEKGGKHNALTNGHHRVGFSSTPSDLNAFRQLARDLAKCEGGRCGHGSPAAAVKVKDDRAERLAQDRAANDARARELEIKARTTTHAPLVARKEEPMQTKPARRAPSGPRKQRRSPKVEAATKWLRWYLGEREWAKVGEMRAAAEAAGHKWPTCVKALALPGLDTERKHQGPRKPQLIRLAPEAPAEPAVDLEAEVAETIREAVQQVEAAAAAAATRPYDRSLEREWGRLEGMAAMLPDERILDQIQRVRALVEEGDRG